jgi:hypothetical protein
MNKPKQGVPGLIPPPTSHLTDGGLREEISDCCNAAVRWIEGGVREKICSKCKASDRGAEMWRSMRCHSI